MSFENKREDFYIGYAQKASPATARRIKVSVVFLFLLAFIFFFSFLKGQRPFSFSFFEFQNYRTFQGTLKMQPYPHLLVRRPGLFHEKKSRSSSYLLVAPFKFGIGKVLESEEKGFANKEVMLEGSLIYKKGQSMIELKPGSLRLLDMKEAASHSRQTKQKLGRLRLRGEIVDSKCYLGVMKPGLQKIHRSCAIRCISGGIPPLFVTTTKEGEERSFLLVSEEGQAVNKQVLTFVAKPVEIHGYVEKKGDLFILKANPKDYKLLP